VSFDHENFPELPSTWMRMSVEDTYKNISISEKIPAKNYSSTGKLAVIDQGSAYIGGFTDEIEKAVNIELPVIVFGDHTRSIKFIDFPFAAGADGIKILKPNSYLVPKLFYWFLKAIKLPDKGYSRHFQYLRTSKIPLAPLNEQKRIADKLDRLLAKVDACRERCDRIPLILKRFRQSVLAAATSGELTEDWREDRNISFDWQYVDIQSVARVGTGSTPLRSNSSYYSDEGIPWVTSAATGQSFVNAASEFVTENAISAHRLKIYPVGTLLVAMYGEGKTRGQVTELAIEATINQACAAVIVDESLTERKYVKFSLEANYLEMRELAEGGNQPNLNLSKIKEFSLHLPSLCEQQEIVRRVEKLFTFADRLESRYQKARKKCDRLTPALLEKAFQGELVPQDPNDEPASVLLERIKSLRSSAEANQTKPQRRKTASGKTYRSEVKMLTRKEIELTHLSDILKANGSLTAEALWTASKLEIDDFYDQLKDEEAQNLLKETKAENSDAIRLLEAA
jgi:restriction endonuclease S subunit